MTQTPGGNSYKNAGIPIATTTLVGLVKPDGLSLRITADGTISVIPNLSGGPSTTVPRPVVPGSTQMPPSAPGLPPAMAGANIDGLRPPARKTVGKDHRFKVKRGIDLQDTNIINAALIPTRPDELASKAYVDQVAAGGGGSSLGVTVQSGDLRYLRLAGGTMTGALKVLDAKATDEPVAFGQLQSYFYRFPNSGGIAGITNPPEGAVAYIEDTTQLYSYQNGVWIGISTFDNPQGGPTSGPSAALPAGPSAGQTVDVGTSRFVWNGAAWDRLTPIDFKRVGDLEIRVDKLADQEFAAPRANAFKPNSAGVNDLNAFLDPGSYRILSASNSPAASGSVIVSALGSGPGIGSNVAVEQMFFAWKEGTTAATIEAGDVYVRVGYGQVWSPWERINQQWIEDLVNSRIGFGKRFVGLYDASSPEIIALAQGIPAPYATGSPLPDPTTVQDRDYLIVKVSQQAPVADPNLPVNDDDGTPLSLRNGDSLVAIGGAWHRVSSSGALPIDAVDVNYINAGSGLAATQVQGAIDELALKSGSWREIQNNDTAIAATVATDVFLAVDCLIFELDLHMQAGTDYWMGKVIGGRAGAVVNYSIAWEQNVGTTPIDPSLDVALVGNDIRVRVAPAIAIDNIRGKYMAF